VLAGAVAGAVVVPLLGVVVAAVRVVVAKEPVVVVAVD
jgi:hypothetical protein